MRGYTETMLGAESFVCSYSTQFSYQNGAFPFRTAAGTGQCCSAFRLVNRKISILILDNKTFHITALYPE